MIKMISPRRFQHLSKKHDALKSKYTAALEIINRLQVAITEEQRRTKYCADNGIIKIPANVFQAIESQLAPRFRFKEQSLVDKGCPHIALTDGKERIAILIPLKY